MSDIIRLEEQCAIYARAIMDCSKERDALRQRLADLEAALRVALNQDGDHSPTCQCRICKAEARLAEAERDAARYRWLRCRMEPWDIRERAEIDAAAEDALQAAISADVDAAIDAFLTPDSADVAAYLAPCPKCGMRESSGSHRAGSCDGTTVQPTAGVK